MRADMTFLGSDDVAIKAATKPHYLSSAVLEFSQGDSVMTIIVPDRMLSCLETIARVFNECMDAGPGVVLAPDCAAPDEPPKLVGGQYIGLTRVAESSGPWRDFTPVGGITKDGFIRGEDTDGRLVWQAGGTIIVTAEVAMQATKCGWELAPEYPTSGDLVAIKR